ncbi:hypothetical protein LIER_15644 [Lithospermum erythrorhizon]|uniref:Uncharacterized protein n=1 Tax=Lithospermum erythrorhizon TaxID=34254 RepID=A0AAV3Q6A7_LITER
MHYILRGAQKPIHPNLCGEGPTGQRGEIPDYHQTEEDQISNPLKTSTGNVFLEIEDRQLLQRPPRQNTSQTKRDMSKFCQDHEDHGHDTDDFRHLKIEIDKLIQWGQLKDYVHKETQSVTGTGRDP